MYIVIMSYNLHSYLPRFFEKELGYSLEHNPVTAVVGPRQSGKSTLVRHMLRHRKNTVMLDLELPSDQRKLQDAEFFFRENQQKLICIDEIQMRPELFPVLRAMVDLERRPGRFLILGSASRDLIRQSGETLAGRIHYVEVTPFLWPELEPFIHHRHFNFKTHWWRGGFPPAFLEREESQSLAWRRDLIQDYLTRDIPQFGFSIPAKNMLRFWQMLAHYHGQVLNSSKLGQALDLSHNTVRKYLDILEQTFMMRLLQPLEMNLKKRLVKSPKIYFRDSGLLHALLEIRSMEELFGHPVFGASWEGWCIEQIIGVLPQWEAFFFRTSNGEELDLVLKCGADKLAFEFKASLSPNLSRGFYGVMETVKPRKTWVVCPMSDPGYSVRKGVYVSGIRECLHELRSFSG